MRYSFMISAFSLAVLVTDTRQSMGIDGFSQQQYDQLVLDVSSSIPLPRPRIFVTLRIPPPKRPREIRETDSSSGTEGDSFGEVHATP